MRGFLLDRTSAKCNIHRMTNSFAAALVSLLTMLGLIGLAVLFASIAWVAR